MDPNLSFASLATAVLDPKEASLWTLASILFDPVDESDPMAGEAMRMTSLNGWLAQALKALDGVPEMATLSALPVLNALLALGDLNAAVSAAMEAGHPRFAALLAGCAAADPQLRKTVFSAQLAAWKPYAHRIPQEHLLVLQLLAGQHEEVERWLLADGAMSVHWLVRLAMRFWFGLGERPAERLALALDVLRETVDVRCSLLALYLHANYHMPSSRWSALSVDHALSWKAFGEISDNLLTVTRISWLLARRLGGRNETVARLQSQLAELLEAVGEPNAALSLLVAPQAKAQLIMRNYDLFAGSMEPSKELMEAQAAKLAFTGASPVDQFIAFASCQDWSSALHIFAHEVGPSCILDGNEQVIKSCLAMIPQHVLEHILQGNVDMSVVKAFHGVFTLTDPLHIVKSTADAIRSVPASFLKENLPIRVALSFLSTRIEELKLQLDLDDISGRTLPLSSDTRLNMVSKAVSELLSS